jgi:UDP-N-acetylmuramate dehydrogenase
MALEILEQHPLAKYTSWRIGGAARFFTSVSTTEGLKAALAWGRERDLPICVLGGGTNVLVLDSGFPGLVVRYRSNQPFRIDEERGRLWVAGGAPMAGTARRVSAEGWAGLAWAEGLPGTIGGAVFGNAGCYGSDIAHTLERAWLLIDGEIEEWPVERFEYGYRTSVLKANQQPSGSTAVGPIVVAAEFRIERGDPEALAEQMRRTAAERKSKTPVGSSCGSVFKNPPGNSAGRLIETAGLKGTRVGNAEVSQKHANYIVNLGGARSDDVLGLVEIIRERVLREHGLQLTLEIQQIG